MKQLISTAALVACLLASTAAGQTQKAVKAAFRVGEPIVSQFEDGAALASTQKVVPGETVFFRFSAGDYKIGDGGKITLTGHVEVFDSRGTAIMPKDEVGVATSLRDEDKEYRPRFHFQFQIPSLAPPGAYKIKYSATDDQTKATASAETTFQVDGKDIPASAQLVVRNFAFYRTADDEVPARSVAYRAGDMVWVKFDITGYKHGEQHAMDVAYDVTVSGPDGKQLFNQENAAVERNQAFYPQPWVPGSFSITLQPNMRPGDYTIMITAHDGVGNQTASSKGVFSVQ